MTIGENKIIDCVSGKDITEHKNIATRIAYSVSPKGFVKFGYTIISSDMFILFENIDKGGIIRTAVSVDIFPPENIMWDHSRGRYLYSKDPSMFGVAALCVNREAYGRFVYSYSAETSIDRFTKCADKIQNKFNRETTGLIPYTFGLEFETANGTIPPDQCMRNGLIPLRDGSISGFEYATIVLKGQDGGFERLGKQLEILKKYTVADKDCSLHIHLGGFPKKISYIFTVHSLCYLLQEELSVLLPLLAFNTDKFKSSGKNYCKKLKKFTNVKDFYRFFAERPYLGSLEQANQYDVSGDQKWRIPTRYFFVNVINALFYNRNKTIEFRCLMPTVCFNKIVGWVFVFSAILKYAEHLCLGLDDCEEPQIPTKITFDEILKHVYPEEICKKLNVFFSDLFMLRNKQANNDDFCGESSEYDEMFFKTNILN
jgi:hypothetical protein